MVTLLLLVCATYIYGVVLHAHPVRGESHIQRNATGEVATLLHSNHTLAKLALKETVPSQPRTSPHVTDAIYISKLYTTTASDAHYFSETSNTSTAGPRYIRGCCLALGRQHGFHAVA